MQDYIQKIIKTGLGNGLTLEQMMESPKLSAKAYLDSQLKSIEEAGKEFLNQESK